MAKDEVRLTTMQVAAKLRCKYQRARDIMLSGKLGAPELDPLTVPAMGVDLYLDKQKKAKGDTPSITNRS